MYQSLGHHSYAIAHGQRFFLIMRDEDKGNTGLALQVFELLAHALTQLQVECGQRLVEQQYFGFGCQRTRQRNTLLLAAGELSGASCRVLFHFDQRQCLRHALLDLCG